MDYVNIQTAQNVVIQYEIASLGDRIGAFLLAAAPKRVAIGGDQHPDPPLPPRVQLRIVPRPVEIEEPDAIAA